MFCESHPVVKCDTYVFFYLVLFLAKYIQKISSISMLVMSLVLTISAWLVNFTYFAYLQSLHILTFAFLSKSIVSLITFAIHI